MMENEKLNSKQEGEAEDTISFRVKRRRIDSLSAEQIEKYHGEDALSAWKERERQQRVRERRRKIASQFMSRSIGWTVNNARQGVMLIGIVKDRGG